MEEIKGDCVGCNQIKPIKVDTNVSKGREVTYGICEECLKNNE